MVHISAVYHQACLKKWAERVTVAETEEYFTLRPRLRAMINESRTQHISLKLIKCPLTNELYLFDKCYVDLVVTESYRQMNKSLKDGDICHCCLFRVTPEMVCVFFPPSHVYFIYL